MILPGSYALTLAILIFAVLAAGSWANTFKLAGPKWRYELYYIDYAVGSLIAALLIGFTFGSMGWDGFSVMDDLHLAGKRQEMFAFLAGCVFNLGTFLLVAAMSIAGMAFSFQIGVGVALITSVLVGLFVNPSGSPLFAVAGVIVVIVSVVFAVIAYRDLSKARLAAPSDQPKKGKKSFSYKAVVLAVLGGLFLGSFMPLLDMARTTDNGVGPYTVGVIFAVAVLLSTLVYDLFFMNLPVQGKPVEAGEYLRGRAGNHVVGMLGGMMASAAFTGILVVGRAEGVARVGGVTTFVLTSTPVILTALWGLLVWKELDGAEGRIRTFSGASLFLYALGIAFICFSPAFAAH